MWQQLRNVQSQWWNHTTECCIEQCDHKRGDSNSNYDKLYYLSYGLDFDTECDFEHLS